MGFIQLPFHVRVNKIFKKYRVYLLSGAPFLVFSVQLFQMTYLWSCPLGSVQGMMKSLLGFGAHLFQGLLGCLTNNKSSRVTLQQTHYKLHSQLPPSPEGGSLLPPLGN